MFKFILYVLTGLTYDSLYVVCVCNVMYGIFLLRLILNKLQRFKYIIKFQQ